MIAYAQQTDLSGSQWEIVLIGLFVIGLIAVLALIPMGLARRAAKRAALRVELVNLATLAWGVVAAGSIIYACWAQLQWIKDHHDWLMSGYDVRDAPPAPAWPWGILLALAAGYVGLIVCSRWRKNRQ